MRIRRFFALAVTGVNGQMLIDLLLYYFQSKCHQMTEQQILVKDLSVVERLPLGQDGNKIVRVEEFSTKPKIMGFMEFMATQENNQNNNRVFFGNTCPVLSKTCVKFWFCLHG